MTLFGDIIGMKEANDEIVTRTLAPGRGRKIAEVEESANPKSVPSGETEVVVDYSDLEDAFTTDSQIFNSINLKVHTIISAGWTLRTQEDADKKVEDWYNKFLMSVGWIGEESTWEEILEMIFQNMMIYGNAYVETVYNKKQTKIVDLILLDPKRINYARNAENKVVFNAKGKPMGYVQTLPNGADLTGKGDETPESVDLKSNQIFLLPKRIAHFKLYTLGDRLTAIGLIQTAYRSTVRQQAVEEANANSVYQRGQYPIIDYVGTPDRYPTPKMIKNATTTLSKMRHNRYFAFPYWHKIEALDVKQSDIVEQTIKALRENKAASLGIPMAFSMGIGEATNRATLNNQQKFLEFSLRDLIKKTVSTIRRQIFTKISILEGFMDKEGKPIVPTLIWGDIGAENLDAKSVRLNSYVKNGILPPEMVTPYAIQSEDLDEELALKLKKGIPKLPKNTNNNKKPNNDTTTTEQNI